MEASPEKPVDIKKSLTVEELNIDILPTIYEIIRSVEKDHHDNTAKTRESQDCSTKVLELQKKLDQARAQINLLPGIEFSKEQQLNNLEALKTQLRLKQQLLHKFLLRYLLNNEQLIQRLSESGPIRGAARFIVFLFNKGKSIAEEKGLDEKLSPQNLKNIAKKFSENVKHEIKQAQDELKKQK